MKQSDRAHQTERFDSESVRRILQRAATEQHRLDTTVARGYSLDELQEMAADVQISPDALEHRLPAGWSPASKQLVLAGGGVVTLSGMLLSLSAIAPTVFWVASLSLIMLCLLVLLGASPI